MQSHGSTCDPLLADPVSIMAMDAPVLTVKNTFLDFTESPVKLKRSSSLPANLKLETAQEKDSGSTGDSLSTDGTCDLDVCTICSCSKHSDHDAGSEIASLHPSDSISNCGGEKMPPEEVSKAPQMVSMLGDTFQFLAMSAIMAISSFQVVVPELNKSCYGFQVVAKLPPQLMYLKESMLQAAKVAVLKAAENSESTYVVGYRNQPYMQSPLGFSALLAHVEPSNACWDLLQWGTCKYHGRCRWEHPSTQATLNVMVLPS